MGVNLQNLIFLKGIWFPGILEGFIGIKVGLFGFLLGFPNWAIWKVPGGLKLGINLVTKFTGTKVGNLTFSLKFPNWGKGIWGGEIFQGQDFLKKRKFFF